MSPIYPHDKPGEGRLVYACVYVERGSFSRTARKIMRRIRAPNCVFYLSSNGPAVRIGLSAETNLQKYVHVCWGYLVKGNRGSSREIERCQEESSENVFKKIEATRGSENPSGCSFWRTVSQWEPPHINPWAGPLSGLSRRELLPLRSHCFWLRVMKKNLDGRKVKAGERRWWRGEKLTFTGSCLLSPSLFPLKFITWYKPSAEHPVSPLKILA